MPPPIPVSGSALPPGRRRLSFLDARALVTGGLRDRGWVWWLSLVWVALGAGGACYAFAMTTQTCSDVCSNGVIWFPQWNEEPKVFVAVGALAAALWMLLAIPVLVAGLAPLESRDGIRWALVCAWISIWIAGVALMVLTYAAAFRWLAGNGPVDPTQPSSTWGSPGPVVGWGELPICAAWLALGAVMTRIQVAPRSRNVPENSGRSGSQAGT